MHSSCTIDALSMHYVPSAPLRGQQIFEIPDDGNVIRENQIKGRPDEAAFVNNWFLLMRKLKKC